VGEWYVAASLIEQLQAEAHDGSVPIGDLLRKAKTAAVKLRRSDFVKWIDLETSGYNAGEEVPQYRRFQAELKFLNPVRGWCPIIGGAHERTCRQSVAEIASMLESADGGPFLVGVPREMIERYSRELGFDADVKSVVQRASLARVIESVRDAVLDWTLKLEQAGVHGEGLSFSSSDTEKAQTVNINIGNIGNAVGLGAFGDRTTITATQQLNVTELRTGVRELVEQLEQQLPSSALPVSVKNDATVVLDELRSAAMARRPDASRLRRGLQALERVMEEAAGHIVAAGALALIAKLLIGS
jgi:hypothetical protein